MFLYKIIKNICSLYKHFKNGKVGTAQELTEEEAKEKVIEYLKKEKDQMKQNFDLVLNCDEFLELVDQIEETDAIKRQQKLMELYEQKNMLENSTKRETKEHNEVEEQNRVFIKKKWLYKKVISFLIVIYLHNEV